MAKFNLGDRVRAVSNEYAYTSKEREWEGKVIKVNENRFSAITTKTNNDDTFDYVDKKWTNLDDDKFKLVKPTKNQRITALENEVAELKLIVHELRKLHDKKTVTVKTILDGVPITEVTAVNEDGPPDAPFDIPIKTANQLRAEIIEKAKAFVKTIVGEYGTFNTTVGRYKDQCVRPIFHVNEKKHAITVLIYGAFGKQLIFKGITKCHPNDVFNEHIGKAIALGRALGLNVNEFEQAVQPTVAIGQLIESHSNVVYKVFSLENSTGNVKYKAKNGSWQNAEGGDLPNETWYKIVDDTNAQYETSESP